jgi:GTP-binding protein
MSRKKKTFLLIAMVPLFSQNLAGFSLQHRKPSRTSSAFINPGEEVYRGMVVGLRNRKDDMCMNVCKGKKLTNMRAAAADATIKITPAVKMSLEQSITFIAPDELLEVTPKNLRIRKKDLILNHSSQFFFCLNLQI